MHGYNYIHQAVELFKVIHICIVFVAIDYAFTVYKCFFLIFSYTWQFFCCINYLCFNKPSLRYMCMLSILQDIVFCFLNKSKGYFKDFLAK